MDLARLLLYLAAALATGAPGLAPASGHATALFRPDAVVEFVSPSGATVARLVVEIAETPEARATGLMGRILNDHMAGMLFLFERAEPQSFWMRNTPSSLDIIFIDERQRVLNIAAGTTPMSDRTYSSSGPARWVVEAKAGFAERFGVREGYTVRWRRLG
jgi:hypothetical protein